MVYSIHSLVKRKRHLCFSMIQQYVVRKENKEFLKESNDSLNAINLMLNYKNKVFTKDLLIEARSVSQLDRIYTDINSKMRENLTKEIKCIVIHLI